MPDEQEENEKPPPEPVRFYGLITRNQLTKQGTVSVSLSAMRYVGLVDQLIELEDKDLMVSIVARQFQPRLVEEPKPERPVQGCVHPFEKRAFYEGMEVCQDCAQILGPCQHKWAANGVCEHCGTKRDDTTPAGGLL